MRLQRDGQAHGQAIVEFAIVLPVLLLLVLALFDGGRAVIGYSQISDASRAGARVAMVNQSHDITCGGTRTYRCAAAELAAMVGVTPADVPVATFTDTDGNGVSPDDAICSQFDRCVATVQVAYTFQPITPIVSALWGDIVLSAETTMQIERRFADPANP